MSLENNLASIPRISLAKLPTPLEELPRLTRQLGGPRLLVKRDDLTGLATGGNKARKLEFLMAQALQQKCDCVLTAGGSQSNHCRQTAAAAAKLGLECHLVIGGLRHQAAGNLLLDQLLGAKLHWAEGSEGSDRQAMVVEVAATLRQQGRQLYEIPVGGSNATGAIGYVLAVRELISQLETERIDVDTIVFATSSGGTQAGIVLGARLCGFHGKILAISIDQLPDSLFLAGVCRVANEAAARLGTDIRLQTNDFETNYDYLGDGYGVMGDLEQEAIGLAARTEGMLVGPVYTGRALGALFDQIRKGAWATDKTVLFWHTGDETALHDYAQHLYPLKC